MGIWASGVFGGNSDSDSIDLDSSYSRSPGAESEGQSGKYVPGAITTTRDGGSGDGAEMS